MNGWNMERVTLAERKIMETIFGGDAWKGWLVDFVGGLIWLADSLIFFQNSCYCVSDVLK